ncbi:hypothetical protein ACOSP7_016350 [Xanthoceras sorbifolium]
MKKLSLSLVGKIVANREISREAFKSFIPMIWRSTNPVEIEAIGVNLFIFRFGCLWDRKRVLEGGPWSFDKHLLILKEIVGSDRLEDQDFSSTPFWVQIYNLPLVCLTRDIKMVLGKKIGEVKDIDDGDSEDCLGKFIRVRVVIDVSKPLKRRLRVALGDNDEEIAVLLCYERFSYFCYYCRCMGHLVRDCRDNPSGLKNISDMKYGAWLKAPASSRTRFNGGKRSGTEDTNSEGAKGGVEVRKSTVNTEEVQPVEVVEEENPGMVGANSVSVGEAPSELNTVVENSVLSMVDPGDVISAVKAGFPREVKIDYPGIVEVSMFQGAAINQEVGSVASSNATELSAIQQLYVVQDSGEVNSPKHKRWKRLARGRASSSGDTSIGDPVGKRVLSFEDD